MRPRRYAEDYNAFLAQTGASFTASMRPRRYAEDYPGLGSGQAIRQIRFNEASALCRGLRRVKRKRVKADTVGFNEASALCRGLLPHLGVLSLASYVLQ